MDNHWDLWLIFWRVSKFGGKPTETDKRKCKLMVDAIVSEFFCNYIRKWLWNYIIIEYKLASNQ